MAKSESRRPAAKPKPKSSPKSKDEATPKPKPPAVAKPKALPLDEAILAILGRAPARTLSPPEIAHVIAPDGDDWHALLTPIRHTAVTLALAEKLVIYRKGKPVDPQDFRGVYRLGLPKIEAEE